ncbi:MAG: hypothetical protein OHK0046_40270 [Anaerolineae bacterium]
MRTPPDVELYNALVWKIVKQIPEGQVSTYGQIASMIQPGEDLDPETYRRFSPQWVGAAMNATPAGQGIPWQRVINSQGKISLPEGRAAEQQRELLEAEGVTFDDKGRVNFEMFGWNGPDAAWLREHDLQPPLPLKKNKPDTDATQLSLF